MSIRVDADALSPRERDVLRELAGHATNAEIAARLFISVRTVESHVAALLRKAGAGDRRALIARAQELLDPAAAGRAAPGRPPEAASTVTSFIGRAAERQAIAAALQERRLVTALGPGGVGKTRLALAVLADVDARFGDGGWYVDLVPVLDPGRVAGAIAAVLGVPERQGIPLPDAIGSWLAGRELLLVLDNCEHLVDGVAALVEHLLLASPGLTVLATSRTRLAVPFEWVFPVPGLSSGDRDEPGDAVLLFEARAGAAGGDLGPELRPRIAAVCAALDGIALAIELAAARLPALGLDGLEAGLADRLPLLSGGRRADDRHRSLRATLDWSYALLPPAEQSVLRTIAVFAAPFGAADAVAVVGGEVAAAAMLRVLAELVDSSLLIAEHAQDGTRYRALETIRQYGAERLAEAGETVPARAAHLAWCVRWVEGLQVPAMSVGAGWQQEFDSMVEDLRAALAWARPRTQERDSAFRLASRLAPALFVRGLPAEAQLRFEEAAGLAPDDRTAAERLQAAAGAAEARQFGTESLRLRREAADALLRAGDRAGAAIQIARAAELINRGPGIIVPRPQGIDVGPLLAEARQLAGDDRAAAPRVLVAEVFAAPQDEAGAAELAAGAIRLARAEGDVIGESAALDALCAIRLQDGDLAGATASAVRRVELIRPLSFAPEVGMELVDALSMSTECALGIGDLRLAADLADRLLAVPYLGGEQHVAASRPMLVTLLAGDLPRCVALAARFRDGWERAGRPRVSNLSPSALAAAAAFALLGDDASAAEWREIAVLLLTRPARPRDFEVSGLEALALLHRGDALAAVERMSSEPEPIDSWYEAIWRPWYAAWWAEAAVLAGRDDAPSRIARARAIVPPNPIAVALVDRADALLRHDAGALPAIADRLAAMGAGYQQARTLVLAGGGHRERGDGMLRGLGVTPDR
ncbi:MAG TPA: LuxR C-terminal-related transcriptional regulator [Amnibacterium sp.]